MTSRAAGMVAVDFDGTLLRSDSTIAPVTIDVLRELRARGWLIVGATGRPPALARDIFGPVDVFTHVVCNNGTLTWDLRSGTEEILDQKSISKADALWAVDVVRSVDPDARFVIDQIDESQTWEPGFDQLVSSNPPLGEMVDDAPATIHTDVRKVITWSRTMHHEALLDVLAPLLIPRAEPTHAGLAFVEIGPPGISKASALALIAKELIPDAPTVAFGDAPNDIEMLRWATVGVAMGNADLRTIEAADTQTGTNNEHGVATFLKSFAGLS